MRPPIHHDNGFPGKLAPAPRRWQIELSTPNGRRSWRRPRRRRVWPLAPHNDLPDALAAYCHFLYGKGADRTFSCERYVAGDASGRTTLENAVLDFRRGVEALAATRAASAPPTLQVTGGPIPRGSGKKNFEPLFPYPDTGNWQKALGSHVIWLSGSVTVGSLGGQATFVGVMTLHAEDRTTSTQATRTSRRGFPIPRTAVTGLAKQYMNYATLRACCAGQP